MTVHLRVCWRRCIKPEWGAAVPMGGPWVQAALLAAVFFLYGEISACQLLPVRPEYYSSCFNQWQGTAQPASWGWQPAVQHEGPAAKGVSRAPACHRLKGNQTAGVLGLTARCPARACQGPCFFTTVICTGGQHEEATHSATNPCASAGLNFGRTALFAGDALYAWGSLALQHASNWRHR